MSNALGNARLSHPNPECAPDAGVQWELAMDQIVREGDRNGEILEEVLEDDRMWDVVGYATHPIDGSDAWKARQHDQMRSILLDAVSRMAQRDVEGQ